jgi:6-phosphogluconolactonase
MKTFIKLSTSVLALTVAALTANLSFADDMDYSGETLYTQTNGLKNQVLAYQLNRWGDVVNSQHYGTAAGLGNQDALAVSRDQRFLFAINAGSNDVSVFRVTHKGLVLTDRAMEMGMKPVSISVHDDLVYVANAGDDSIFGFKFDSKKGKLKPMKNSHRKLGGMATGVADIQFDKDGDTLVITEKAANKITSVTLNDDGLPVNIMSINSTGNTPFGFAFGKRGQLFVSNAEGGAANASTVSAYKLKESGKLEPIGNAVAAGQTAACWLVTTPNGRMAFTANTPADSISTFAIDKTGHPRLLMPQAATASKPTDLAISRDGDMLYSLNNGDNSIGIYRVSRSGEIIPMAPITNIPAGATGLVSMETQWNW